MMTYLMLTIFGMVAGGLCVFILQERRRTNVENMRLDQVIKEKWLQEANENLQLRQQTLNSEIALFDATKENRIQEVYAKLQTQRQKLDAERAAFQSQQQELDVERRLISATRAEFDAKVIAYEELSSENALLKVDLRNIDISVRKHKLDHAQERATRQESERKTNELCSLYLKENVKWISASLTPNNLINQKQRLHAVIERCRDAGFTISSDEVMALVRTLQDEFECVVRAALEREEQARIKAKIREEQALERELEQQRKQAERERELIQAALSKALKDAKDVHSDEITRLEQRLAEAEEKARRAVSQAQLTKTGHVYVISNIGSFGEGVYKVGMTRRLEPVDRIRELGDASVPFPFDVHMMISSDDAPALENALHRALHKRRVNKINPRKEFFKTEIETIVEVVKEHHGEVEYLADVEALEYRQSVSMTDDEQEFIEHVYEEAEEDGLLPAE